MQIQQLMGQPAITCRNDDNLTTAARLMWDHDCGAIPVVDEGGRLAGIVTDRDVCMAAYTTGRDLGSIPVSHAMAKNVATAYPSDTVESAEYLMRKRQVHRIPVVDDGGYLLGMLSLSDIARHLALGARTAGHGRELIRTLAAVTEPRSGPRVSPFSRIAVTPRLTH
jgi:CBS domain-containing protein